MFGWGLRKRIAWLEGNLKLEERARQRWDEFNENQLAELQEEFDALKTQHQLLLKILDLEVRVHPEETVLVPTWAPPRT